MKRSTLLWWLGGLWCATAVILYFFPPMWPLVIVSSTVLVGFAALLLVRPYGADERRAWYLYLLVVIWGLQFMLMVLTSRLDTPLSQFGWNIILMTLGGISLLIANIGDSLERHPTQQEIERSIRDLSYSDKNVRVEAVRFFVKVPSPKALESLIAALADEDEAVRYAAADALGATGDERALDPLLRSLQSPDPVLRDAAASALGTLGFAEAVPALVTALTDDDAWVRGSAAWALGELKDSRGVQILTRALEDSNPDVRAEAANALGELGDPSALPMLQWVQQHDLSRTLAYGRSVRDVAASAIKEIQKQQDAAS